MVVKAMRRFPATTADTSHPRTRPLGSGNKTRGNDMPMLEGKVAVVTGAGGGIGREIAVAMALAGAKVVINDIGVSLTGEGGSSSPAEQTKQIIEQRGGTATINTDSVSTWDSAQ